MNRDKPGFISKNSIYLPLLTVILDLLMHRMLPSKQSGHHLLILFHFVNSVSRDIRTGAVIFVRAHINKVKNNGQGTTYRCVLYYRRYLGLSNLKINLLHLPYFPALKEY